MKIYDLSIALNKDLWFYGAPYVPFKETRLANLKDNGYIARKLTMTTHTGTHVECGAHWREDGEGVDEINPDKFIGKAKVLRIPAMDEPLYAITRESIKANGGENLNEGDICIVATGWDAMARYSRKYCFESPFFTPDAAEYFVEKKVKLVASDFPMCGDPGDGMDYVPEGTLLPDCILFENHIPIVMGLVNLDAIPDEVQFVALPLKVQGADGAPVRAIAIDLE